MLPAPAFDQAPDVHRCEADLFDQPGDRLLGLRVVAGHEDRVPVLDRQTRIAERGQVLVVDRVEGLDEPRSRQPLPHFFARGGRSQVEHLAVGPVRVHGVDDDLSRHHIWRRQRLRSAPGYGQKNDAAEPGRVVDPHGVSLRSDLRGQAPQGRGAA